jgi:ubiquinone/menaquinone biosynthesis C-methylase UbiE/uncharacterized protein YbaR (Trm112 family)
MKAWLAESIVCPRDKQRFNEAGNRLVCPNGHSYPVIDGIPILLVDEETPTHDYITDSLREAEKIEAGEQLGEFLDLSKKENAKDEIDAFVQGEVPYTCGNLYFSVQHTLKRYPFPNIPIVEGHGKRLLDVGCNWGRWTIPAQQKGYDAVGIDPSLKAVLAARRISRQLGVDPSFIVGDARFLPFANDTFDMVFSYGVMQHFSKENAKISFAEMSRVLKRNATSMIQMPNRYGVRQYQQHRRRGFTEGEGFDIRYWTPSELLDTFEKTFGTTKMSADCYFGLSIQGSDIDMLPLKFKAVVYSSQILRRTSRSFTPLVKVADSVFLESVNQKQ